MEKYTDTFDKNLKIKSVSISKQENNPNTKPLNKLLISLKERN